MRALVAPHSHVSVLTDDNCKVDLLHLAGSGGPVALFLPANGFHVRCYSPLAKVLAKSGCQCWGLEFRGQGGRPLPPGNLVELYLIDLFSVIHALKFEGCCAFAHSGGAQVAIRAEAQQPGTFAAIYAYEPVYLPLQAGTSVKENGKVFAALAAGARRRRSTFKSRQDAAKRYRSRPPFNTFSEACFQEYMQHGITQLSDGTCSLSISPENEARWYTDAGLVGMTTGFADPPKVHCPIVIAVGNRVEGESMNYLAPVGLEQTSRFSKGRSESFDGLGHLGPLEDPATVAARVVQCFAASKDEKTWAALLPSQTIPTQHQAKL